MNPRTLPIERSRAIMRYEEVRLSNEMEATLGKVIRFTGSRSASVYPPSPSFGRRADSGLPPIVSFDRRELQTILNVYGRGVAEGEWRDYAIDFTAARAVFSIFRRTSEVPLFRVEKDPRLRNRQGAYSVLTSEGYVLKRGHDLDRVVEVLDRRIKLVLRPAPSP